MTEQDFRDLVRYLMANPFLTDVRLSGPLPRPLHFERNGTQPPLEALLHWSTPAVGPAGQTPLPAVAANTSQAVCYVTADVAAREKLKTQLCLGTAVFVEAWINGKKVYQGRPSNSTPAPDQASADVVLEKGINHVVFRVTYGGSKDSLYARFVDPGRKLTAVPAVVARSPDGPQRR
jgi:hypothetical protein